MESETEALSARAFRAAEERLEQLGHRRIRNLLPRIGDPKLQKSVCGLRMDSNGFVRCPVRQRIANQVGDELSNSRPVAVDGLRECEFGFDRPARRCQSEFVDDLMKDGLKRPAGITFECDAAAEPTAGKIQHVVDQAGHPHHGCL